MATLDLIDTANAWQEETFNKLDSIQENTIRNFIPPETSESESDSDQSESDNDVVFVDEYRQMGNIERQLRRHERPDEQKQQQKRSKTSESDEDIVFVHEFCINSRCDLNSKDKPQKKSAVSLPLKIVEKQIPHKDVMISTMPSTSVLNVSKSKKNTMTSLTCSVQADESQKTPLPSVPDFEVESTKQQRNIVSALPPVLIQTNKEKSQLPQKKPLSPSKPKTSTVNTELNRKKETKSSMLCLISSHKSQQPDTSESDDDVFFIDANCFNDRADLKAKMELPQQRKSVISSPVKNIENKLPQRQTVLKVSSTQSTGPSNVESNREKQNVVLPSLPCLISADDGVEDELKRTWVLSFPKADLPKPERNKVSVDRQIPSRKSKKDVDAFKSRKLLKHTSI